MESEPPLEQQQTPGKTALTLEDAHDELDVLLDSGRVTSQEVAAIKHSLKEQTALREKVSKLKSLLGRSAKAQREAKMELEQTQRKLASSQQQVEKLAQKVEKLASRPTHMDLLADFESNFDRALLKTGQTGGQDTTSAPAPPQPQQAVEPVDAMLLHELAECKSRINHLESLNTNYKQRSVLLEQENLAFQREKEHSQHTIKSLQLELRMAQMEKDHALRALEDKTASLQEMQLEIDLVTKASVNASVRAAQGEQAARAVLCDRQQVHELRAQVQALQEWALASAEQKSLAMEHVRLLEKQLKQYKQQAAGGDDGHERVLWNKNGSLVVGAGDVGFKVLDLGEELSALNDPNERIVLRWQFDCTPSELSVDFSILKGICDSSNTQSRAEYLIQNRYVIVVNDLFDYTFGVKPFSFCADYTSRTVTGGAAGEMESAFAIQNACTLLWSNESSWVRPRTVKFSIEVVALKD